MISGRSDNARLIQQGTQRSSSSSLGVDCCGCIDWMRRQVGLYSSSPTEAYLNNNYESILRDDPQIPSDIARRKVSKGFALCDLESSSTSLSGVPRYESHSFKNDTHLKLIFKHPSSLNVMAKGFEVGLSSSAGGALGNLMSVMTGKTQLSRDGNYGSLTLGARDTTAGPHGPFYVVFNKNTFAHTSYLVPTEQFKKFLVDQINKSTIPNKLSIINKIQTYEDYCLSNNIQSD